MKPGKQCPHGFTLRLGPSVTGVAQGIEATLVADADAVLVMALAVGTLLPQWPALMHLAVARDIEVVSDILPPPLEVVFFAPPERVVLCRPRRAAMQHYQCYCTHNFELKTHPLTPPVMEGRIASLLS